MAFMEGPSGRASEAIEIMSEYTDILIDHTCTFGARMIVYIQFNGISDSSSERAEEMVCRLEDIGFKEI